MHSAERVNLANELDFALAQVDVCPSACRISVNGAEMRVEAQTMAVLVVLARAAERTVTREELIAACWRNRVVSDDAIARTIAKVRALARNADPPAFTIATVPKVGYRLNPAPAAQEAPRGDPKPTRQGGPKMYWLVVAPLVGIAALALFLFLGAGSLQPMSSQLTVSPAIAPHVQSVDVVDAILNLDEARLQTYVQHGWNPNWHLDSEGNAALHTLMLVCERNPTHDRMGAVRVARLLVDAGAKPSTANKWGDTPLSIARARQYCGPDHPVVAYLRGLTAHSTRTAR